MVELTFYFHSSWSVKLSPPQQLAEMYSSSSVVDSEREPDYRDVTIRTDVKVKELYDVEERLGT